MTEQVFGVAVRDGGLYLFLRLRRGPKGDIYTLFPRPSRKGWNPHVSYHASGQLHHKSYGHEHLVKSRQKLDQNFRGWEAVMCTPIGPDEHRAINITCAHEDFAGLIEIPASEIAPQHAYLSVDLVEPDVEPNLPAGARLRLRAALKNAFPWLLVTLYDYPDDNH